jgi:hypothetical protein
LIKKLHILLHIDDLNDPSANSPANTGEPLKRKLMRDLSWLILFSYILLIFNPVMPIVADVMAHTFWEKQHLLTVHEVNGKFHVHFELIRNAKQAEKDKAGRNSKTISEEYVHLFSVTAYNFSNNYFIKTSYPTYTWYCPVSYPDGDFRPPRA